MFHKLVLLSLASIAIARPNGAPICDVDTFDTSTHGGATSDLKYDIAVTPEGNKATIAINDQFIGLLLYVSDASGKHVGSLQPSSGDFKIATDCGGQSTITHSSSASKSGKFEWSGTETGPLTVNAIVMKNAQVWNIFKVALQIGQSSAAKPAVEPTVETSPTLAEFSDLAPENIIPAVEIAIQENEEPLTEAEEPKPEETPQEMLPEDLATIQEPKPEETTQETLPEDIATIQEPKPEETPQEMLPEDLATIQEPKPEEKLHEILKTPTVTPSVIEEPKEVTPVINEPYQTQEKKPIAVPQASSPVQENPYAVSNPPENTYPKRKNRKRKNYKKKKTYSNSGKHSSSAKKPCPKTYNKNQQPGMNQKYWPTENKIVYK